MQGSQLNSSGMENFSKPKIKDEDIVPSNWFLASEAVLRKKNIKQTLQICPDIILCRIFLAPLAVLSIKDFIQRRTSVAVQ